MMKDFFEKLKGQFKIECLDKNNNVIDSYEEHNAIMTSARRTVAEMFSNYKNVGLNYLVLGTCGGTTSEYIPITEDTGFSKERTCLYSESILNKSLNEIVHLRKNELVKVNDVIYKYNENEDDIMLSKKKLTEKFLISHKPYVYKLNVSYGLKTPDGLTNYATNSSNICKIEIGDVNEKDETVVTFTFELGMSEGNSQHNSTEEGFSSNLTLFNEAAMYFNNRIFCMKCFPAKVKDDSTKFRIIWKIIF